MCTKIRRRRSPFPFLSRKIWNKVLIIGCNVAINYANSAERAEKFAKELKSTYPKVKIVVIQGDVGVKSACEKLVTETIAQLGGLDVIISNAGTHTLKLLVFRC
jgi:NAD(P)-dependent dehydrogenase (short-subunit alcohol dehydrogenase family)